jgi:uncharacterized protein (TIGR03067 family)
MRLCLPLLLLGVAAAAADEPKTGAKEFSAEAKKELKKPEGKWPVVKVAGGGKESELDKEAYFAFQGAEVTLTSGDRVESLQIAALDPATDPKCIDLLEKRKGRPDRTLEGVYRIDGDMLQIAHEVPTRGKNRPTGFEKSAEGVMIWTLKRVKE